MLNTILLVLACIILGYIALRILLKLLAFLLAVILGIVAIIIAKKMDNK